MAGHSKWANIQHRKGRQDAARSKLFSKLSREITVAAKMGDPDPEKNLREVRNFPRGRGSCRRSTEFRVRRGAVFALLWEICHQDHREGTRGEKLVPWNAFSAREAPGKIQW